MRDVLAIDPGCRQSAMCRIDADTLTPLDMCILENGELLRYIKTDARCGNAGYAAIEMLQSYGNLIGRDVLETAVWIGRFYEALAERLPWEPALVYRMEEKMHICQNPRAGDAEIRRALIDRFCDHDFRSGRGTKKEPDFFHGFKKDIWAAYAVGLTYIETKLRAGGNDGRQ